MCLEDLKLGMRRFKGKPVTVNATTNQALLADNRRVAILVSAYLLATFDNTGATVVTDAARITFGSTALATGDIQLCPGMTPFLMRIEDYGKAIQEDISVNISAASGLTAVSLVPILSDIETDEYRGDKR